MADVPINPDHEALANLNTYLNVHGGPTEIHATREQAAKGWGSRMSEEHYRKAAGRAMTGQHPEPRIEGDHAPTTPWGQYTPEEQEYITRVMAEKHGITGDMVKRRAGAFLDESLTRHKESGRSVAPTPSSDIPGRDWYADEGHELARRARQENQNLAVPVTPGRVINGASILSPNTVWEKGGRKVNADLSIKNQRLVGNPKTQITVTGQHVKHLLSDAEARPKSEIARRVSQQFDVLGMEGTRSVGERSSEELATLGSYSGTSTKATKKTLADGTKVEIPNTNFASDLYGHGTEPIEELSHIPEAQSRHNTTNALSVMRGEKTIEEALSMNARKPRTFNSNLLAPYGKESKGRATVDRWEAGALTDDALSNPLPNIAGGRGQNKVLSEDAMANGAYAFLEHHAGLAAGERGLHPQEAQAIRWTQVKGMTEGFRQFGDGRPTDPQTKEERARHLATFRSQMQSED